VAIQSSNPPDVFTLEEWKGLNQQTRRTSIDDQEAWWLENLFPLAPGTLRAMWGPSAPIYTAPAGLQILRIFTGYYGNDTPLYGQPPPGRKGFMMLSDGTADEVDLDTGLVRHIGQCWLPISPKFWCSVKVWRPRWVGSQLGEIGGVVIGSPAGLFAWDGYQLYVPNGPAPLWLTNADTNPFPGMTTMPDPADLPGIYALEVYENRLWAVGKDVVAFSMPGNGADFTVTDGGGFVAYFGDRLVHDYVDLQQSSGYLFLFGDSSIDVINNVQMAGGSGTSPAITNFNYYNIEPTVGQRFPRPAGRWGRFFTIYNGAGIFEFAGGDAQMIGQKTLDVYNTIDSSPSTFYPTMAPITMFGMKAMLFNIDAVDPFGVRRSLMLVWHGEQKWSAASQWLNGVPLNLTDIVTYEDNSVQTAYGTDRTSFYRLFDHPDPMLPKRLSTKAYIGSKSARINIKNWKRIFVELHDNTMDRDVNAATGVEYNQGPPVGVSLTGTLTTQGGGIPNGSEDIGFALREGELHDILPHSVSGMGISGAIDLQSTSPDWTLERIHVTTEERTQYGA